MMLLDGASCTEMMDFVRAQMARLLSNQLEAKDLVMTKGISKPLDQYTGAVQTHVEVAKQVSLLDSQADEVSSLPPGSASTPGNNASPSR